MMPRNQILSLLTCTLLVAGVAVLPGNAEHGRTADVASATDAPSAPTAGALPDATLWRHAASTGEPLRLELSGRTVAVSLDTVTLWRGALEARDTSGDAVEDLDILPLDGTAVNDPGALVRVTVSGERVTGVIHSTVHGDYEIATGSDGTVRAFPDALVRTLPGVGGAIDDDHDDPAATAATTPVRAADVALGGTSSTGTRTGEGSDGRDGGAPDCLSAIPETADPAGLLDGWSTRVLEVAFPVDIHYTTIHEDWVGDVVAAANTLDGLYQKDFDLAIEIVHIIAIPPEAIPGPGSQAYLTQTAAYYADAYPGLARDAVYLGVANPEHSFGGQAECIGGAGFPEYAYGVGTTDSGAPYSFTGYETLLPGKQYKIAAHEIGHLLTAHHHHANCIESVPGYDPLITMDVCTVMINDWGLIQPVFSSLNRLVVRDHADQHDL